MTSKGPARHGRNVEESSGQVRIGLGRNVEESSVWISTGEFIGERPSFGGPLCDALGHPL